MPNMDGTGPRGKCRGRGERSGGCEHGHRRGHGAGCCRVEETTDREALLAAKAALQARLESIEKRLQEL